MNILRLKLRRAWVILACGIFLQAANAMAAEVIARVDRAEIVEGETITLVLQTDDPQQSLQADLSVLERDFGVLDQRSETQMSIVNGRQVAMVRLMLTLEPKRLGDLMIPPLSVPGNTTSPIPISVKPAPELAEGEMPPVFIEMALDPADGPYYVHAQLALTVRIFYQQNLTEAAINPPAPAQASVRLLDEIPFQSTRSGTRYRVLERRYAIFPERSGELEIPPLTLSGRLIERPADRLWQPSVRGRRVTVESDPVTLSILPRPADYTGDHWLPARRITLSQQISDADSLKVGEPVTRTVILDAVGLEENMIEEPVWPELRDARIYPDQPQGISRDDGQWVLGHKEFRYAVVPEKAGELVLPEIRLGWWDTTTNRQRAAVLPEHRVTVTESDLVPNVVAVAPVNSVVPAVNPNTATDPVIRAAMQRWRLLAIALGVLWLLTLTLYLRKSAGTSDRSSSGSQTGADESALLAELKSACKHNDATRIRNLLGQWLRRYGPDDAHGSLMEFARNIGGHPLQNAIYEFDACEFSSGAERPEWNGAGLWRAFEDWRANGTREVQSPDDEPHLYARG